MKVYPRSVLHLVPGSPQPEQVLSSSTSRTGIIFFPPNTGTVAWKPGIAPSGSLDGIVIASTSGPFNLTLEEHGDIVQQAWFAWISPNTAVASLIERLRP